MVTESILIRKWIEHGEIEFLFLAEYFLSFG